MLERLGPNEGVKDDCCNEDVLIRFIPTFLQTGYDCIFDNLLGIIERVEGMQKDSKRYENFVQATVIRLCNIGRNSKRLQVLLDSVGQLWSDVCWFS